MYSTRKFLSSNAPKVHAGDVCGSKLVLEKTSDNFMAGGLRLAGQHKISEPDMPLVTVITVVRNRADTIVQCMLSVFEQTYENIEYIIIDGGSTDETLLKISEYDPYINYYISEPDKGIYNAMNKGLNLASGYYILFLNADDWYRKDAVRVLLDNGIASKADVTYADAYIVNSRGRPYKRMNSWLHDGIYTRGAPIRHETMLVKAQTYNKIGYYNESYSIIADYDYMIRLYSAGCSFNHVRQPLLYFRDHGISNVAEQDRCNERARLFRDLFPFMDDEDVSIMKPGGRIPSVTRRAFIEKYRDKSSLLTRSMECNIADPDTHERPLYNFLSIAGLVNPVRKMFKKQNRR